MSEDKLEVEAIDSEPDDELQPGERNVYFENLIKYNRAIKKRGKRLIISYAGINPVKISVSYLSGHAAREAAGLLMADLRRCNTDLQYNNMINSFRSAIYAAQNEREEKENKVAGKLSDLDVMFVPCPQCGEVLELSPVFADKALDLCPKCNAVEVAAE